jgi:cell wall-associated NlpC family hydrolase
MGFFQDYTLTAFISTSFIVFGLPGCTSTPSERIKSSVANERVQSFSQQQTLSQGAFTIARKMVGAPYRYGGADPRGFDCSGLVYYSYLQAGMRIPRTTSEQYRQSKDVEPSQLQPGDLLFFTISRNKPSHVGIYAGQGRFIHAPSSGKSVSYASLSDNYWKERLRGTRRLLTQ